jgi:O-antigen ligase
MNGKRQPDIRFLLAMMLFFFISGEISILGRAYYAAANLRTDTIRSEYETLLQPSIILTFAILVLNNWRLRGQRRPPSAIIFNLGVWCWLIGASISAIAHLQMEMVILVYLTGAVSGALVYFASRSFNLSISAVEQLVRCVMIGGLIPGIQGVWAFYQSWGIPSLQTLLYARYDLPRMQPYIINVENTGGAACFFVLLAAPCMAILALRMFHRNTRMLTRVTLLFCILNLIIDEARTSFIALLATWFLLLIFSRSGRRAIGFALVALCVVSFIPTQVWDAFTENLGRAVTYSRDDRSASDRIESIKFGWRMFLDNPLFGVGPGQSDLQNPFMVAHDLVVSQASEVGFLGLIGFLLMTTGSLSRMIVLLRKGPRDDWAKVNFMLTLGPTVYFTTGLVAAVWVYNTFHNTWICLVMGFVGLSDGRFLGDRVIRATRASKGVVVSVS